jgi:predicted DNA-binding transcriptional regulator YafY
MSEVVRLYRYRDLLRGGHPVTKERLMQETEVSPATFKRDLQKLRDQLNVPIEFDREVGGYVLRATDEKNELPGMWFSSDEIIGLATIQSLLVQLAPSLMSGQLRGIQDRLNQLLAKSGINPEEMASRILLMPLASREADNQVFSTITRATLERKRLVLTHHNRQREETATREVSPIDIEHYRDNWYLSAWCHTRNDIRRFSIDAIKKVRPLESPAISVDDETRRERLQGSYGIFSGTTIRWASIRFTAHRARWVSTEVWHPQQRISTDRQGRLTLEVPYSDDRELVADILRHGAEAEVIKPKALRDAVAKALKDALKQY